MTSEISENTIFVRFDFPQCYLMITMSLSPSKESAAMLICPLENLSVIIGSLCNDDGNDEKKTSL